MVRNILDYEGNVVGQMELPDNTPEEIWQYHLQKYLVPPTSQTAIPNVTPRQIRQALILQGVPLPMIDDALNALPEPTRSLARAEWEYSVSFDRNRPLVAQVGQLLGWTPQQLDDLWKFAATL